MKLFLHIFVFLVQKNKLKLSHSYSISGWNKFKNILNWKIMSTTNVYVLLIIVFLQLGCDICRSCYWDNEQLKCLNLINDYISNPLFHVSMNSQFNQLKHFYWISSIVMNPTLPTDSILFCWPSWISLRST